MSLFYVARYQGPEAAAAAGPEGAEAGAHGRARALLERLQSRARERQQQREPAPTEAAAPTEPATRRRRRPRRRRRVNGAESGSPEARQGKRRKADGEDADAGGSRGERAPSGAPATRC